ncbi:hypothetical protein I3842_11G000300 [Carya illinoinensis]|uniref:Uncharacterized protein n=1 Tax=Carya illinoinensis TaxID=32201 RepID=A0A922DKN7_CARIL|nr:hypothetical protein I3842_11G000300 [Carya illinoinensis]
MLASCQSSSRQTLRQTEGRVARTYKTESQTATECGYHTPPGSHLPTQNLDFPGPKTSRDHRLIVGSPLKMVLFYTHHCFFVFCPSVFVLFSGFVILSLFKPSGVMSFFYRTRHRASASRVG